MPDKKDTIEAAIDKIRSYVLQTLGHEPDEGEIARSLTKYFTLREIAAHIRMERDED